ncbi:ISWI related chromatinic with an apicomplexan specific domain [Cryptosporidium sp. chipmunk genotype I]|uniref:ISWI related chromatinic with an apicomplexan specific domain n=1 Tax=Cryptosporidium sp. chipmunk genotype I TaxID=1280935 RepID=UPI003519E776|nr:ISWI related chromatinic with an apicomplexan specific domain [Cryptosporidium sp. chipmunk genotype I]
MARQGKGLRRYCDICRDGDTDLRCSQCGKVFHLDCLRNCNLVSNDTEIDEESFCCPDCKNNEDFCYICRDNETGDIMLYCDGCPKSAHLGCLGLEEEPDSPTWYCPNCDNDSGSGKHKNKQTGDVRTLGGTKKTNDETDINSDSCYVCQKGGKLLGCDFCTYSYHPKCIETEVFAFDGDKWKCPVCRGEDPLKNMRHKRMTKSERYKLSQQWQNCIKKQIKQSSINRDVFLWENRQAISPFVSRKVLERLKKNAETYRKANLNQQQNQSSNTISAKKRRIRKIQEDDAASDLNSDSDADFSESNRLDSSSDTEDPAHSHHASDGANFPEFMDAPKYREAHIKAKEMSLQILSEGIELKDYQRYGVHWLLCAFSIKGGAILADEMGLGKTIQTLTFLACLKALGITGPHLIVVPLSTVGNWAREARRFTPGLTLTKICGSRWEREHAMMDPVASDGLYDLYITTYETVVTEESFFVDNFRWQCIVLDEAHRIKNEGGRIRHSMDRVSGSMRVLLTGTPLQNSLKELFTLLNFLYPDILQDSEIFEKIFQMKDITKSANSSSSSSSSGNGNHGSDDDENIDDLDALGIKVDSKRVKLFHCLLQKLLLRRTKDLVIKLPDKIIRDIWLPLSPSGWQWYKRLLDVGNVHGDVSFRKLLGLVIKMRICCSHPRGLVARSSQLDKLFSVFAEASPDLLAEVTDDAYKLKSSFGWEHVKGSSKLFFLDKLLMQLHRENCKYIPNYKESHDKYTREQIRSIKSRIFELRNKGGAIASGPGYTSGGSSNSSNTKEKDLKASKENTIHEILSFEDTYQVTDEFEESFKSSDFKDIYSQYMYDKCSKKAEEKVKIESSETTLDSEKIGVQEKGVVKMDVDADNSSINGNANGEVKAESDINNNSSNNDNSDNGTKQIPINTSSDQGSRRCKMHKILIFTQFQLILDELENYCLWRGWQYMRLDGSTNKLIRELDIREFGLPDNYVLVYLICTRAGGLGINLVSANHVVMYDEDWNPFVDLQAVDRAHRIGQTRDVCIWKLVTEWSVEERMVFGREQKLKLDKMIIKGSARDDSHSQAESTDVHSKVFENDQFVAEEKLSAEEVTKLIRYGRRALMHLGDTSSLFGLDLEALMDRKRVPIPDEDVLMQKEEEEKGDDIQNVLSGEDGQQVALKADEEVDITDILCDEIDDNPSGAAGGSGGINGSSSTKTMSNVNTSPSDEVLDPVTSNLTTQNVDTTSINISPTTSGGDDDSLWRSKRTRKPPPPVYNPLHWEMKSRSSEDKKPTLKHERSCFRCGQAKLECSNTGNKDRTNSSSNGNSGNSGSSSAGGGTVIGTGCCGSPPNYGDISNGGSNGNSNSTTNTTNNGKDANSKESATSSSSSSSQTGGISKPSGSVAQVDEYMKKMGLINCNRCPKSYHWSQCLGLDKVPPRTWICPWHECCLCFRRATQAGGLLIHCSECPTTFCIDCFPPEYARHQVLDSFFENLNKRGWNVSRDSMILFLCSKCKALQQQEIRKKLSRQQLLEEQQRRRKMNEQLKSDVLKSGQKNLDQFAHLGPNSGNRTSPYLSGRKRNIEAAWKLTESLIRKGFERLFPPLLYKLQQEYIQENAKHEAAILAAATSGTNGETDPDLEKQIGGLRKSPWMRPPGEWLRLCDNCLLPFHDVSGCPYPLEVVKVSVPSGVTQIDVQTGQPLQLADGTKIKSVEEFILLSKNGGVDSKFQTRSYCSLCGLSGRMHTRRSCPLLPDEAEQEYEKRQSVLDNFIQTLNTFQVEFPSELTDPEKINGGWESYRKATQKVAEEFLRDCFLSCNLHKIITPSGTAYIGRQNVARSVVYGAPGTGMSQIQGSSNVLGVGNMNLQSGVGGMSVSNSGLLMHEGNGGGIPSGAMAAYLGLGGGLPNNSRNSKQALGRGDQSGIGTFSGCSIPTSSTMSAAAVAIQQRMNDAAVSLARARYAAAAAAAAVSVVGFRHPQPILPFPMVQTTAPPHPYGIFTTGNPVSAAAAAAAAAASAPLFFGVSNPNMAAANRANMFVGANMAASMAVAAAAAASATNSTTNFSTSNPPSPPLGSKKRAIDALKTENSNGNIINQGTGSANISNGNNSGGFTETIKSIPISGGDSPPNKVKVIDNSRSNNQNPELSMDLPLPSSSDKNL